MRVADVVVAGLRGCGLLFLGLGLAQAAVRAPWLAQGSPFGRRTSLLGDLVFHGSIVRTVIGVFLIFVAWWWSRRSDATPQLSPTSRTFGFATLGVVGVAMLGHALTHIVPRWTVQAPVDPWDLRTHWNRMQLEVAPEVAAVVATVVIVAATVALRLLARRRSSRPSESPASSVSALALAVVGIVLVLDVPVDFLGKVAHAYVFDAEDVPSRWRWGAVLTIWLPMLLLGLSGVWRGRTWSARPATGDRAGRVALEAPRVVHLYRLCCLGIGCWMLVHGIAIFAQWGVHKLPWPDAPRTLGLWVAPRPLLALAHITFGGWILLRSPAWSARSRSGDRRAPDTPAASPLTLALMGFGAFLLIRGLTESLLLGIPEGRLSVTTSRFQGGRAVATASFGLVCICVTWSRWRAFDRRAVLATQFAALLAVGGQLPRVVSAGYFFWHGAMRYGLAVAVLVLAPLGVTLVARVWYARRMRRLSRPF